MYKLKRLGCIIVSAISLAACGGNNANNSSNNVPQGEGEATYQLTFNAKWNRTAFPTNFPNNAHFSSIIGATHNNQDILWRPAEFSSLGVASVAETGSTRLFNTELEQKKSEGNVDNIFIGNSFNSPGSSSLQFMVSSSFPYVSAITMIAPSPDWFVGIRDVNLYIDNAWVETLEFDLKLYDSGTDTGETFSAANAAGGTGIITLLTTAAEDTDFNEGSHRSSGEVVGTITLQRISEI